MENELHDLLVALDTQIDGVESYLRKINELGHDQRFNTKESDNKIWHFGLELRVTSRIGINEEISWLRKHLQRMRDAADKFDWSLIGE